MKEFIDQLYDNDNSLAHKYLPQTHEVNKAHLEEEKLVKELEPLLSKDAAAVFEKLRNVQIKLYTAIHRQAFSAGVRTGARLMTEVFGDD